MCKPNVSLMQVSLNLNDTPIGYKPQLGPEVYIRLSYNHRDSIQPASPDYSNLGPRWTHSFLSYIQDTPSSPGTNVTRYILGGGSVDYTTDIHVPAGQSPFASGEFKPEIKSRAVLKRIPSSGTVTSYTLTFPDGTIHTFADFDGASTFPRRVFLSSITDPQGNALTLDYDGDMRLETITDAAGRETTFGYDGSSKLIESITDPFGRTATLTYSTGKLASITDVLGITSSFTYDSGDPTFIEQLTTPYGNHSFTGGFDYDSGDRWLELTDPEGFTERVEYKDGASGIGDTEADTPSGMTVENGEYDKRNTFHWDKEAYPSYGTGGGKDYTKATIYHWTLNKLGVPAGILASIKKPLEGRVYYSYPGQPASYPAIGAAASKPTKIGRVLDDSSTQLTSITYNAKFFPTEITDPLGRVTKFTYGANNTDLTKIEQKVSATPTWATLAEYTYDTTPPIQPPHKPLTYKSPSADTFTYTYNAAGQVLTETAPGSIVTTYGYDADGRLESIENDNEETVWTFTYDTVCGGSEPCDLPETATGPDGVTRSFAYDALNRVTSITYPDTTTELFNYTGPGPNHKDLDLLEYTDRLGRTTSYAYNDNRRLEAVQTPEGITTGFEYFKNGKLKKLIDGNGNETLWTLDVQGRPTLKTFDDATATAYGYEAATSRLKTITDELGQVKTYGYNNAGELTSIGYTNEVVSTPNVSFTWDAWYPRPVSMSDGIGTTTWSYVAPGTNGALQLATEDGPFSNDSAVHAYDDLGRLVSLTVGGTAAETWTYDNIGRVATHGTLFGTFTYGYLDETGLPVSRTLGGSSVTRAWSYDTSANDRRLLSITGTGSQARSFAYDWDGSPYSIAGITESAGSVGGHPWTASLKNWAYSYDDDDRLLIGDDGSTEFEYAYDDAGNKTTLSNPLSGVEYGQSYTSTNALDTGFTFDDAGNRLTDTPRIYSYDAENRLVDLSWPGSPNHITFVYDGLGRRLQSDRVSGSTTVRRYQWCGNRICAYRDGSDVVHWRFYEEGQYEPTNDTALIYMKDHLGSVRDAVNLDGDLMYAVDYSPYGYPTRQSEPGGTADFQFAGLFREGWATGLMQSATRFYDSWGGVWLTRDPIGEEGGINLYAYVEGNPVNFVDPEGLAGQPPSWPDLPKNIAPKGGVQWFADPSNPRGGTLQGPNTPGVGREKFTWDSDKGYWKRQRPGQKGWERFSPNGTPLSPTEAHPGNPAAPLWPELLKRTPFFILPEQLLSPADPSKGAACTTDTPPV